MNDGADWTKEPITRKNARRILTQGVWLVLFWCVIGAAFIGVMTQWKYSQRSECAILSKERESFDKLTGLAAQSSLARLNAALDSLVVVIDLKVEDVDAEGTITGKCPGWFAGDTPVYGHADGAGVLADLEGLKRNETYRFSGQVFYSRTDDGFRLNVAITELIGIGGPWEPIPRSQLRAKSPPN